MINSVSFYTIPLGHQGLTHNIGEIQQLFTWSKWNMGEILPLWALEG